MCGIGGIINLKKKRFDYQSFCQIGIDNDSRGGDSCGVFIDGKYEYGTASKKYFEMFYKSSDVINETISSQIALVHCRKASIGKISEETAQPVVIKNDDGEVEFVVLHNGTIYNYDDLAKKYIPEIDINGMTDSQVMARIFYYKGYDVLSEYIGGAVFCIVDYREGSPNVFLFKGASKTASGKVEEERPFFFVKTRKSFYFSSISTTLYTFGKDVCVFKLSPNILCKVNQHLELDIIENYDRTNCVQYKAVNKTYNYNQPKLFTGSGSYSPNVRRVAPDMRGNYFLNEEIPCHGHLIVNDYGSVRDVFSNDCNDVYFYNGIRLYNKDCFDTIEKIRIRHGMSVIDIYQCFGDLLRCVSPDPYCDSALGENTYYQSEPDTFYSSVCNGMISYPFTWKRIVVKDGEFKSEVWGNECCTKEAIAETNDTVIDLEKFELEMEFEMPYADDFNGLGFAL